MTHEPTRVAEINKGHFALLAGSYDKYSHSSRQKKRVRSLSGSNAYRDSVPRRLTEDHPKIKPDGFGYRNNCFGLQTPRAFFFFTLVDFKL
jgi:hypothetical protein